MTPCPDLPARFRAAARAHADNPAILATPPWTFAELDRASDALAAGLAAQGVQPGERVALLCPNGAWFVVAWLGIVKAGAVVVPVNLLLNPAAIAFMLEDCGVVALLAHDGFAEAAAAACAAAPGVRLRVAIEAVAPRDGMPSLDDLLQTGAGRPPPPLPTNPHRDAVILYTSGTTGRPKGAVLTHGNLLANASATAAVLGVHPGQARVLVVLPMFHAFAATVGILTPLLHGAALIPVARFDPALITAAVGDWQATIFLGVPSLYAVLLHLPDAQVARWAGVQLAVSGGAALPLAVRDGFEARFGIPILEGDGPTECGPVTCVNPPAGPRKPGSVGPPLPGMEMSIRDADGAELPVGTHGEVCVRGPSVMRGYWNLPEATAEAFFGDWFRTGDLGWRDADGWFYLVDRIKDLIIVNGMNVYPRILEEALVRHPAVAEAAVVGEPHPLHGELPVAYVTLVPGARVEPRALKDWCREQLGRHEQPRRIEVRASLPKNAAGKVIKRELRRAGEVERGMVADD